MLFTFCIKTLFNLFTLGLLVTGRLDDIKDIHVIFKEWHATCLTVLISNCLILIVLFIMWLCRLYKKKFWYIISLFTFPLYLLSNVGIFILCIELINTSKRHNTIFILSSYILFIILFTLKIIWCLILEHNPTVF